MSPSSLPPALQGSFRRDAVAVVLGLGTTGLGAVRALGEQGIRVIGVDWAPRLIGATSRYCERAVRCADPAREPRQVVASLLAEAQGFNTPAVLLPMSDVGLDFLGRYGRLLEGRFLFTLQEPPLQEALTNKRLQYDLAEQVGTPYPQTFYPRDRADVARLKHEVRYPALLKPAASHLFHQIFHVKALQADSPDELERRFAEIEPHRLELMVQSLVPGPASNESVHYVYVDRSGDVLATFLRRKLRNYPADFGVGTLHESGRCDEVEALGLEYLRRIGYRGNGSVQFKRDARDGRFYFLELNGRLGQSNIHATRCGVNLPLLAYLDLTGQRPAPLVRARAGVRYLDLLPDIESFLTLRRQGELGVLEWLRSLASVRVFAHFDARDPLPLLAAHRYGRVERWLLRRAWLAVQRRYRG